MKNHFLIPVISILSLSTISNATENKLDDVVVTATRTAISADESIVPVVVITDDDIQKSAAKDLVSLLSGIAGIDISQTGGLGKQSSVFLRGTESRHVMVLIDGIKVGSVSLGTTSYEHLPLEQIDKIEVIKGPRSSLYGSDAVGGVIQIFTKKGNAEQGTLNPQMLLAVGTDKTYKSGVSVAGGANGFSLSFGANYVHSDGYNAMTENNPDKDGYKNSSLLLNAGKLWENGIDLSVMLMEVDAKNEYDNQFNATAAFHSLQRNSDRSVKIAVPAGEKLDITAQLTESVEEQTNFQDGAQTSIFESTRRGQNLQFDLYPTDEITLTAGFDNQRDSVEGTTAYDNNLVDVDSRYLQGQFDLGMVSLLAGYRYDDNSTFGDHDTWNVGFRINPPGTPLVFTPSVGTAFKAPTVNDLYWPYQFYAGFPPTWPDSEYFGNPDLLPETSKTIDIGVGWRSKAIDVQVNVFHTEVNNLISWQSNTIMILGNPVNQTTPVNIGEVNINGAEFTLFMPTRIFDLSIDLAHTEAKDSSTGNYLMRRSKESAKIKIDKSFSKFDMAFELKGYGPSYNDAANTIKIPGYGIVNAVLAYRFSKDMSFTLRGENLYDKNYTVAKTSSNTYVAPGRSLMLEFKVGF